MEPDDTSTTLTPSRFECRDIGAERGQPFAAQLALGAIDQKRRSDFDDDQLGAFGEQSTHRRPFAARRSVLLSVLGLAFALPVLILRVGFAVLGFELSLGLALPSCLDGFRALSRVLSPAVFAEAFTVSAFIWRLRHGFCRRRSGFCFGRGFHITVPAKPWVRPAP